MKSTVVQAIAQQLYRLKSDDSKISQDAFWCIKALQDFLPCGSGVDAGTVIDLDKSTLDKIVFSMPFHYMNGDGFYDGWFEFKVTVKPSFIHGLDMRITGKDPADIKDYLAETLTVCLQTEIVAEYDAVKECIVYSLAEKSAK